ncbi:hypothetical protein HYT53_01680 [Candidatus Woesearchaeota archaeon]|nr:hypothetical protein [Candidatus Woesearchaeota archaeon]
MTTKKQRRRIKELAKSNLTTIKIAEKLGVKKKEVEEVLQIPKSSRLKTKTLVILGAGLIATAGVAYHFLGGYHKRNELVSYPTQVQYNIVIKIPDLIQKFEAMPLAEQSGILSSLEQFTLQTRAGKRAQYINDAIKVKESLDTSLSLNVLVYSYPHNVIYSNNIPNSYYLDAFIRGSPLIFLKAHERLHFIQDTSSKWDMLETLLISNTPDKISPTSFNKKQSSIKDDDILDFIRKEQNNPTISSEEATKLLLELIKTYESAKPEIWLIREVQANLALGVYTSKELYEKLQTKEIKKASGEVDITRIGLQKFEQVFRSTLELLAIYDDPIESAKFVGKYGNSVAEYVAKVEELKIEKGVKDALQIGLRRQNLIQQDTNLIRKHSINYVVQKYLKSTQTPPQPSQ